jgi:hypothetical protein
VGIHRSIAELNVEPLACPGCLQPLSGRVLRRLEDGTVRSVVVQLDGGAIAVTPTPRAHSETWFVLNGRARLDGRDIRARDIVHAPAGSMFFELSARGSERAELLRILWPASAVGTSYSYPVPNSLAAAGWIDVKLPGVPPGIRRAEILGDPVSGGDLRALQVPPGFEGKGPNWHPCGEEILCLEGDVAPDDAITLTPGDYLFNPARGVHGYHEHSHGGALLIEWHDGPWSINFL